MRAEPDMNDRKNLSEFLFLMRGTEWDGGLSPREAQDGLEKMMAWVETIRDRGLLVAGQPLTSKGRMVTGAGVSVTDGPFMESKEAVGGYFIVQAGSLEDAVEIAKECPTIKYGLFIEVRPIVQACAIADRVKLELARQPE